MMIIQDYYCITQPLSDDFEFFLRALCHRESFGMLPGAGLSSSLTTAEVPELNDILEALGASVPLKIDKGLVVICLP